MLISLDFTKFTFSFVPKQIAFVLVFTCLYAILIVLLIYGYLRLKNYNCNCKQHKTQVSIIVAVRNEISNIENLLNSLLSQQWLNYEVIIVDDYSNDGTYEFLIKTVSHKLKVFKNPFLPGKKFALAYGVSQANSEIILFTDADCVHSKEWIKFMICPILERNAQFVIGNVFLSYRKLFSSQALQSLEFASLQATGQGAASINLPFIANAANLAFKKDLWKNANINMIHPSGDDVLLLHEAIEKKLKIEVQSCIPATVQTKALDTFKDFFYQRIRWTSKTSIYQNLWARVIAVIVFLVNLELLFLIFLKVKLFLIAFFIKSLVDFVILFLYLKRYNQRKLLVWFWFVEILYIFYAVLIGILSQLIGFRWKGRKYKKQV